MSFLSGIIDCVSNYMYYTSLIKLKTCYARNQWKVCTEVGRSALKGHLIKRILRSMSF